FYNSLLLLPPLPPPSPYTTLFRSVNVFAVADLTRLTLPALRAASGQVIAINSGSGHRSRAGGSLYSGTKFALRAFTDALREEERSEEHTSELQSRFDLVCRLLLET